MTLSNTSNRQNWLCDALIINTVFINKKIFDIASQDQPLFRRHRLNRKLLQDDVLNCLFIFFTSQKWLIWLIKSFLSWVDIVVMYLFLYMFLCVLVWGQIYCSHSSLKQRNWLGVRKQASTINPIIPKVVTDYRHVNGIRGNPLF